jgi:hypothetical protein
VRISITDASAGNPEPWKFKNSGRTAGKSGKNDRVCADSPVLWGALGGIWIDSGRMTDEDDGPAVNHEGKQMRQGVQGGAGFPARARSPEKSFTQSLTADERLSGTRGLL